MQCRVGLNALQLQVTTKIWSVPNMTGNVLHKDVKLKSVPFASTTVSGVDCST